MSRSDDDRIATAWSAAYDAFAARGWQAYGESVTQTEHALQSAAIAASRGMTPAAIVGALLHDIGHLLHDQPDDVADDGVDTRHEDIGADWLVERFGPEVAEPVRLHVDAKRYLCARREGYADTLSSASRLSLALQGGPMNDDECAVFESSPWFEAAIALREIDDLAKATDASVPPLAHWETLVASLERSR